MHSHWLLRFDLHRLILALAVIGVLATFGNSFYAIYQAQRQLLIDSTLEANRVYATKLAASTETMLRSAQGQLAYGAARLAPLLQGNDLHGLEEVAGQLRQQTNPKHILLGLLEPGERFDLTMCNPPFHASMEDARAGSTRKWKNLGKGSGSARTPLLNFGGRSAELVCAGGEAGFVRRMI